MFKALRKGITSAYQKVKDVFIDPNSEAKKLYQEREKYYKDDRKYNGFINSDFFTVNTYEVFDKNLIRLKYIVDVDKIIDDVEKVKNLEKFKKDGMDLGSQAMEITRLSFLDDTYRVLVSNPDMKSLRLHYFDENGNPTSTSRMNISENPIDTMEVLDDFLKRMKYQTGEDGVVVRITGTNSEALYETGVLDVQISIDFYKDDGNYILPEGFSHYTPIGKKDLPENVRNSKSLILIENKDDLCFFHSVIKYFEMVENPAMKNKKNVNEPLHIERVNRLLDFTKQFFKIDDINKLKYEHMFFICQALNLNLYFYYIDDKNDGKTDIQIIKNPLTDENINLIKDRMEEFVFEEEKCFSLYKNDEKFEGVYKKTFRNNFIFYLFPRLIGITDKWNKKEKKFYYNYPDIYLFNYHNKDKDINHVSPITKPSRLLDAKNSVCHFCGKRLNKDVEHDLENCKKLKTICEISNKPIKFREHIEQKEFYSIFYDSETTMNHIEGTDEEKEERKKQISLKKKGLMSVNTIGYNTVFINSDIKLIEQDTEKILISDDIIVDDYEEAKRLMDGMNYDVDLDYCNIIRPTEDGKFKLLDSAKYETKRVLRDISHGIFERTKDFIYYIEKITKIIDKGTKKINEKRVSKKIHIYGHNSGRFDGHFIMREIARHKFVKNIKPLCTTMENYISFTFNVYCENTTFTVCFIDYYKINSAPLEELIKSLKKEDKQFLSRLPEILHTKGEYPYDWFDNKNKFDDKQLPPIEAFDNKLTNEKCPKNKYERALKIWDDLECKTFRDYHNAYLMADVYGLTDAFFSQRKAFKNAVVNEGKEEFEYLNMELFDYLTIGSFGWDCMLKITGETLPHIGMDMYKWYRGGITGGISYIWGRKYEKKEGEDCAHYVDANSLYVSSMDGELSLKNHEWISKEELEIMDEEYILNIEKNNNLMGDVEKTHYDLEVEIEIPKEQHNKFRDYPPTAVKRKVDIEELDKNTYKSLFTKEVNNYSRINKKYPDERAIKSIIKKIKDVSLGSEKLICDLKTKIIKIDIRLLCSYIKSGCKVIRVLSGIKSIRSRWMKPFVDFCQKERRKYAKNTFENTLWKNVGNTCYGKSIENPEKRRDIRLCKSSKELYASINHKLYDNDSKICIFSKHLVAVPMLRKSVKINKPIYVGFGITQISKKIMFDFVYDELKPNFPSAEILATDTDSIIFKVNENEDDFMDKASKMRCFDFSSMKEGHKYYGINKEDYGKYGLMKFENMGIKYFVGLKSKMYYYETVDNKHNFTSKGINKKQNKFIKSSFEKALNNDYTMVKNRTFRSFDHKVYVVEQEKIGLDAIDTKSFNIGKYNYPFGFEGEFL